jgi:membrane-bound lytic murein transglycosylase MltF
LNTKRERRPPRPCGKATLALLVAFFLLLDPVDVFADAVAPVALPTRSVSTGDLDTILESRRFRLIVPYSKTHFYIDRGRQMGVAAEFGREFEAWLNRRHAKSGLPITVVLQPAPRDVMLNWLVDGRGDAVAGNLAVTPERRATVDFARPWLRGVDEILVTGPTAPHIARLEDLAGMEVPVRSGTSFSASLADLNADFAARGLEPVLIVPLSARLQAEDVLQMVNAGLLPWAITDSHLATVWSKVLRRLKPRPDIAVKRGDEIAWAIRKGSPLLAAELDAFFAETRDGTGVGSTIRRRYFENAAAVRNAGGTVDAARFVQLAESFRRHGTAYGFDPLMLAAQGYQESGLDQSRRSRAGAVGVMQLLPATASAPPIGIRGVDRDADANIRAGAAYMAHLRARHVNDPELHEVDRTLMTFAAYNAGAGNLRKFRRRAEEMGLDPNVWFDNVEVAAARIVGAETVQYVSNIYKYYVAYDLAARRATEAGQRSP